MEGYSLYKQPLYPCKQIRKNHYEALVEEYGETFNEYTTMGVSKGSPLSPILGALALMPLDEAMSKIERDFNFLGYYMCPGKLVPSKETVRRFKEKLCALYEQSQKRKKRRKCVQRRTEQAIKAKHVRPKRDTSEYYVNEPPPGALFGLLPYLDCVCARYVIRWKRWVVSGLQHLKILHRFLQFSNLTV